MTDPATIRRLYGRGKGHKLELIRNMLALYRGLPFVLVGAGLLGLGALLAKRLRGQEVAATDRLPLGTLMALAAWPIWIVISR